MIDKLNRIWGYLNIDKTDVPFFFDSETFELILFPVKDKCGFLDINLLKSMDFKNHQWIEMRTIRGTTAQGYSIIFRVYNDFNLYANSTRIYQVQWGFYYRREYDVQNIHGFNVTGDTINAFYPPTKVIESDLRFNANGGIDKMAVEGKGPQESDAGSFGLKYDETEDMLSEEEDNNCVIQKFLNVDIKIEAYPYITTHSENPLKSTSEMNFEYENPASLWAVIENYRYVRNFFMYVCYRSEIVFKDTLVYWVNDDGRRDYAGRLIWKTDLDTDDNLSEDEKKKQKECIIKYDLLREHTADLFNIIGDELLSYDHLVPNIQKRSSYPISRFITVLTAFEREYRNIYHKDSLRSPAYRNFKERIVESLNEQLNNYHRDERRWFKNIIKGISNRDDSYKNRFQNALINNMNVMRIFLDSNYSEDDGTIEAISTRVGGMRNDLAHNNIDMEILPINLSDINIVEKLLYCIRLRNIGLSVFETQKAIAALFGDRSILYKLENEESGEAES